MSRIRRSAAVLAAALVVTSLGAACGEGDEETEVSAGGTGSRAQLIAEGKDLYVQTCSMCHGVDLKGTDIGPPFLTPIYAPDHHPDGAFFAAVANGVEPHHWEFGPMPAQPDVSPQDVAAIVAYVRDEQAEAGLIDETPAN
jgi:mono/diheme cytochrome c family protein